MFGTVVIADTEVFDVRKVVNKGEDGREVIVRGIVLL